jgi:hypothetical protein
MSVLLPEPDGPMMAVQRPASKSTSTASSARTAAATLPWFLARPWARTAVVVRAAAGSAASADGVGAVPSVGTNTVVSNGGSWDRVSVGTARTYGAGPLGSSSRGLGFARVVVIRRSYTRGVEEPLRRGWRLGTVQFGHYDNVVMHVRP